MVQSGVGVEVRKLQPVDKERLQAIKVRGFATTAASVCGWICCCRLYFRPSQPTQPM